MKGDLNRHKFLTKGLKRKEGHIAFSLFNLFYNVRGKVILERPQVQTTNRMSMTSSIEILIGGHDEKSIDLINERLIYLITPTWREMNIIFNICLNV